MSTTELSLGPDAMRQITTGEVAMQVIDQKQVKSLLAAERRTLEMIAGGASLTDVLEDLCDTIDDQAPDIISSILLMDPNGEQLWPAAGRRVPEGWVRTITPLPIGPGMGSCGTAAFMKKPVIVSDIASDPPWSDITTPDYTEIALSYGLRAAWSQPLISKDNELLGTFAIYYREPRQPSDTDLKLIEGAANIAVIAIKGERSQTALKNAFEEIKQSEARLRKIIDTIPTLAWCGLPDASKEFFNKRWHDYTGLSPEEASGWGWKVTIHPDDLEKLMDRSFKFIASEEPGEVEARMRRFDGEYRWFLFRAEPLRDEHGNVVNWYGTDTDIEDRKQAEEQIRSENLALREEIDHASMFEEIVGSSEALHTVLRQVARVSPMDSTVLILGETGVGKELIARAIHKRSNRATRAFIRVNCAAIPPSLIASELFGHEKGAFTGATQRRLGRFESANGGTIFLDEIGDLPAETQIALLRVLQEGEFERVGSSQPIAVDVRVLAATNRDLKAAAAAGTFRQDLFYRFNVFPIQAPSLRERVDDIPLLVEYLIERYAKKTGKKIKTITKNSLDLYQAYDWPGNIRELQNVVERAVILSDGETFSVDEKWLKHESSQESRRGSIPDGALSRDRKRERAFIEAALADSEGRVSGPSGAATRLGIPRQTLESKIRSLGIDKHRFRHA